MARFRNPVVGELKGSLGGLTFSKNHSGGIVRFKSTNINPSTKKQIINRNRFSKVNGGWHTLTDEEKTLWNEYGNLNKVSGINSYISVNKKISSALSVQINVTNNFYSINGTLIGNQSLRPFYMLKLPPINLGYNLFFDNLLTLNLVGILKNSTWELGFDFSVLWNGINPTSVGSRFLRFNSIYYSGILISGAYLGAQNQDFSNINYENLWFSGIQQNGLTSSLVANQIIIGIRPGNQNFLNKFLKPGVNNYRFRIERIFQNGWFYTIAEKNFSF